MIGFGQDHRKTRPERQGRPIVFALAAAWLARKEACARWRTLGLARAGAVQLHHVGGVEHRGFAIDVPPYGEPQGLRLHRMPEHPSHPICLKLVPRPIVAVGDDATVDQLLHVERQ